MTTYVYPYKPGSQSAKELANAAGVKRIKHGRSRFKGDAQKTVINWGASAIDNLEVLKCRVINPPDRVRIASNKLNFFRAVQLANQEALIPEFTTDIEVARGWLRDGHRVVVRRTLTGHSGHGTMVCRGDDKLPQAPMYVKYIPKKQEYRVHVMGGRIIDKQRKARKMFDPNPDWEIRSHERGFVFSRQNVTLPECVVDAALKVADAVGLDFAALDVIYNEASNRAYVLEANTAPGLEGSTIKNYIASFKELFNAM